MEKFRYSRVGAWMLVCLALGAVLMTTAGTRLPGTPSAAPQGAGGSRAGMPAAVVVAATSGGCPSGWHCADVGTPSLPGGQSLTGGTWTLQGAGWDIWTSTDQFHYVWRQLAGEGALSARVTSQSNTASWAKAGLMLRQGTDPGAPFYAIFVTAAGGIVVDYRTNQGGTAVQAAPALPGAVPVYLRLARSGSSFTAYTSRDGSIWTLVPGSSIAMSLNTSLLAGFAVTAHNGTARSTATFETGGGAPGLAGVAPGTSMPWFAAAIDTMKESMDTDASQAQLSDTRIAATVNAIARLNTNYITVDTFWEYPSYTQRWIAAIRATGRHVWFRMHPSQWENDNGASGTMTPTQYELGLRTYILAHPSFFKPGDIFDPCPEASNSHYWNDTYGASWGHHAPDAGTAEFNAFLRDTSDIADAALHQLGIYGVITMVHSLNPFWYLYPQALEPATVARLNLITIDDYIDSGTTNPATAVASRLEQMATIENRWHLPILIGEMGYPTPATANDATQAAVLQAEFRSLAQVPYLAGVNYWAAVQASSSILAGANGNWTVRPAGASLAAFFAGQAQAAHLDSARFSWDGGISQRWSGSGVVSGLTTSTALVYGGRSSLVVAFAGPGAGSIATGSALAGLAGGSSMALRVYVPPGVGQLTITPYMIDARGMSFNVMPISPRSGIWTQLTFTIPGGATAPLQRLGLAFKSDGPGGVWYLSTAGDSS